MAAHCTDKSCSEKMCFESGETTKELMDWVYAALGGRKCGRANEASRDSGGYQGAVGWTTQIRRGWRVGNRGNNVPFAGLVGKN